MKVWWEDDDGGGGWFVFGYMEFLLFLRSFSYFSVFCVCLHLCDSDVEQQQYGSSNWVAKNQERSVIFKGVTVQKKSYIKKSYHHTTLFFSSSYVIFYFFFCFLKHHKCFIYSTYNLFIYFFP